MKQKISAGLLMYRIKRENIECFIVHPGGPFWKHKDVGAWSLPKGEVEEGESLLDTAQREFHEETGIVPRGPFTPLGSVTLKSGKQVHAWAFEGDWSGLLQTSTYVRLEWPKSSGKTIAFPEIDKAGFFSVSEAQKKLNPAQKEFIERLLIKVNEPKS